MVAEAGLWVLKQPVKNTHVSAFSEEYVIPAILFVLSGFSYMRKLNRVQVLTILCILMLHSTFYALSAQLCCFLAIYDYIFNCHFHHLP